MDSEERKRGRPWKPRCGACEHFEAMYASGHCTHARCDLRHSPGDMCPDPQHSFMMAEKPSIPEYYKGEKEQAYLKAVGWQPREN